MPSYEIIGGVLMTAVAEVKGKTRKARVRVFLDLGSQASFLSSNLVKAIMPSKVGTQTMRVATFGAPKPVEEVNDCYEVHLTGISGEQIRIQAYERAELALNIEPVAPEKARFWEAKGLHLGDSCFGADADVDKEVHLLIGAD